jgi:hypothetical protein
MTDGSRIVTIPRHDPVDAVVRQAAISNLERRASLAEERVQGTRADRGSAPLKWPKSSDRLSDRGVAKCPTCALVCFSL